MTNRIYSFLGLATKAGRVISGEDACQRAMKAGRVVLVIVAEDASENTRKKFANLCKNRNVALRFFGEKALLGKSIGKEVRSVIAVTDKKFAGRLIELIDGCVTETGGV